MLPPSQPAKQPSRTLQPFIRRGRRRISLACRRSQSLIVFRSYVRLGEAVVADGIVIAKNGALDAARGRRCAPAVEVYSALVISFSGPGTSRNRRGAAFS